MASSDPSRVLVLGGTGHIGAAIARAFDQAGYAVTATGRSTRPRPSLDGTSIAVVSGDDTHRDRVAAWTQDKDIVLDAATPYPLWLHKPASARQDPHPQMHAAQAPGLPDLPPPKPPLA